MTIRIQRLPTVTNLSGRSKSALYNDIQQGLFTKPVSLGGARAVGWPSHEVQTILAARIAGKNNDEIKKIVVELEAARLNFTVDKTHKSHPPFPAVSFKTTQQVSEE